MEVRTLGRLLPESGKRHQNQEIYDIRGVSDFESDTP